MIKCCGSMRIRLTLFYKSMSLIWRSTGGKLNSDYFVFKIGGEW